MQVAEIACCVEKTIEAEASAGCVVAPVHVVLDGIITQSCMGPCPAILVIELVAGALMCLLVHTKHAHADGAGEAGCPRALPDLTPGRSS